MNLVLVKGIEYTTHDDFLKNIAKFGLPVNPLIEKVIGIKNMIRYHNNLEKNREKLEYEIDGTVFKINNYNQRKKAGSRSRSPRWAIAGKFKAQQATSIITDIIIQVGRTGALTPVARVNQFLFLVSQYLMLHYITKMKLTEKILG